MSVAVEPWDADDWKDRPTVERLQVVHDLMDDQGICPYFRRGEPGQDPQGICSFGCREEPSCMTDRWGPWPSELLREVIADLTAARPVPPQAPSDEGSQPAGECPFAEWVSGRCWTCQNGPCPNDSLDGCPGMADGVCTRHVDGAERCPPGECDEQPQAPSDEGSQT